MKTTNVQTYSVSPFPRPRGKVGMGAIVERALNADSLQNQKNIRA
jgi:hypothetical protein